ncbi:conserved hypothetical protein [Methylobacterium nodulans ORS 2060]|uniref:GIY-YIG domain-containing protein n=2 Tax=Methylobacterium nodulans TaxID=114616 RepID=B8IGP2_METNO|nr:conserved hypothetical protein [Methylobacterium nodulans ORS 2060]
MSCGLLNERWCGLAWTPWAALERSPIRSTAPALPGVYRVRYQGGDPLRLVYVGQTGRSLRERLLSLAGGVNATVCPFNDPHTAAPHLWLLRTMDGARFECSCAVVEGDVQVRRGTEDMLLWRHRVETGTSVEANYGRFYPGYERPTNRWIVRRGSSGVRTPGRRAVPVPGSATNGFSVDHPALQGTAGPLESAWWERRRLTKAISLPTGPAVYCIYARTAEEPLYIGETSALAARAAAHAAALWPTPEPWLAYLFLPENTPKHVLRELESDLLGWHFWRTGRAPAAQYSACTPALTIGAEPV